MTARQTTEVDRIAEQYVHEMAALDPLSATGQGLPGFDDAMTDYSPEGEQARADLVRATLAALEASTPVDETDLVTVAAMRDRLGLQLELHEAGEAGACLNNLASPLQAFRDVLDLMPIDTVDDWQTVASRVGKVPEGVRGYIETLREGARRGLSPARRQVAIGVEQAAELADPDHSFFVTFAREARAAGTALPAALASDLEKAASAAASAYGDLRAFLADELAPNAPDEDAVGHERYARFSRSFIGATIDLDETYEWGLDELDRVVAEQDALAAEIAGPGASVADAVAALDADPARKLHGTEALQRWMQQTSDEAVRALNGVHFDIPPKLQRLECMIAPTQNGGIYYTGPSEDFTRPGRMWWSVPKGVTEFDTWRELTTVYHEGVPGHHLQIATATDASDELNLWRRIGCWMSGYGEGWALYAERLMAEFGFLDDPGDRLGMLDGQRMRATRVVLDIGVHLGKPAPARWGGGIWDADKAWALFDANVNMNTAFKRFEVDRYLGWPGQAPSYKVGQRIWEQMRADADAAARARSEEFSLRDWHTRALNLGALPLDVLREQLVR